MNEVTDHGLLNDVLAEYLDRLDDGDAIDRSALVATYPELTFELAQFFEDWDAVSRVFHGPGSEIACGKSSCDGRVSGSLGDFELRSTLGLGGMGVVYKAFDRRREELVALKMLHSLGPESIERLKQEFRSLASIVHRNLVSMHELYEVDEKWFFTMELLLGCDFASFVRYGPGGKRPGVWETVAGNGLATKGEPSISEPLRSKEQFTRLRSCLTELVAGLTHLHEAGKLHRDIKPSNVFVTRDGRLVLLDFGLSLTLEPNAGSGDSLRVAGTAPYMSPEQLGRVALTPASDWYSVGVMLFEAICGRRPFAGSRETKLRQLIGAECVSGFAPAVPEDLAELTSSLLHPEPCKRPTGKEIQSLYGEAPLPRSDAHLRVEARRNAEHDTAVLFGRDAQLSELGLAFEAARSGTFQVVSVEGRSGMGKTSLVTHFLSGLPRDEALILHGRCFEREAISGKALDGPLTSLARYLENLPESKREALLDNDFLLLGRMFPTLNRVVPKTLSVAPPPAGGGTRELRRAALGALRKLLFRLSEEMPLVMFVDDLQWSDADSATMLHSVLLPPGRMRLLFIGAYRSEGVDRSEFLKVFFGDALPSYSVHPRRIVVNPLKPSDAARLAIHVLNSDEDAARGLARRIAEESAGFPYFVHELARSAGAQTGNEFGRRREASLDEVLWSRIEKLPDGARRLLTVTSVSGKPIPEAIAAKAVKEPTSVRFYLRLLSREGFTQSYGSGVNGLVETRHDRIRETVISRLSPTTVTNCHHDIALALEESGDGALEDRAVHFWEGGNRFKASRYARLAGDGAVERFSFDQAVQMYKMALDGGAWSDDDRRAITRSYADALGDAGRPLDAALLFLDLSKEAERPVELLIRAAPLLIRGGEVSRGMEIFRATLRELKLRWFKSRPVARFVTVVNLLYLFLRGYSFRRREREDVPEEVLTRIHVLTDIGTHLCNSDNVRGVELITRALVQALRVGVPDIVALPLAIHLMILSYAAPRFRKRRERLISELEELRCTVKRFDIGCIVEFAACLQHTLQGEWKEAARHGEQSLILDKNKISELANEFFFGWSLYHLGRIRELCERMQRAGLEAQSRGDLCNASVLGGYLGNVIWLIADKPDTAQAELDRTIDCWRVEEPHLQHVYWLFAQLQIDLYRGEGRRAWERVKTGWSLLRKSGGSSIRYFQIEMRALSARAAVSAALDAENSAVLLGEAKRYARWLRRCRMLWAKGLANLADADIAAAQGDTENAMAHLGGAITTFQQTDMALHIAIAKRRLGELTGGEGGEGLVAEADKWMRQEGIVNPAQFTTMLSPRARSIHAASRPL